MSIKPFSAFLSEAKVSVKSVEKALAIFKKFFERRLSTKLYRYGGEEGVVEIKKGVGFLYIYDRHKAIRFNYIAGEVQSITLWKSYKLGAEGDKTISLDHVNLTQAATLILDIIENGVKVGVYPFLADPGVKDGEMITEARKISPADFIQLIEPALTGGETLASVPHELITQIAAQNDVSFPSVFWAHKVKGLPRGSGIRFDMTPLASATAKGPGTDVSRVTVTASDKQSTQNFMGGKRVAALTSAASSAVNNPDVNQAMKDPANLFGIMHNLVQLVCRGARKSLIIYGGPGTGKTHTVKATLKEEGLVEGDDWIMIKGKISTSALYQTLFLHRKDRLLVFDDTDSVWGDQEAANILKAALDSYDERLVSWVTKNNVNVSRMTPDDKEAFNDEVDAKFDGGDPDAQSKIKLPSEFLYTGKIIFISNLGYDKFDSAVLTRAAKIDMTLTDEQMFIRMEGVLEHLGDKGVPLSTKKEILQFLKDSNASGALQGPSMRTFVAAEDLYRSGLPNWKELLDYV